MSQLTFWKVYSLKKREEEGTEACLCVYVCVCSQCGVKEYPGEASANHLTIRAIQAKEEEEEEAQAAQKRRPNAKSAFWKNQW